MSSMMSIVNEDDPFSQPADELDVVLLMNADLKSIGDIAHLAHCTRLQDLNLHCNQLTRIDHLAPLGSTLLSLNLSANNIHRIEGLDALRMLRELNLSSNRIQRLEGLSGLHELTVLNVSHNQLTEIGPVFDADSFQVRGAKLRRLDVRHNRLGGHDESASSESLFKSLLACTALRELLVNGNFEGFCIEPESVHQALPWLLQIDSHVLRAHDDTLDISEHDEVTLPWVPVPFSFPTLSNIPLPPMPLPMPLAQPFMFPSPPELPSSSAHQPPKSSVRIAIVPSKHEISDSSIHAKKSDIADVSQTRVLASGSSHRFDDVDERKALAETVTATPRIDAALDRYLKRAGGKAPKSILKHAEPASSTVSTIESSQPVKVETDSKLSKIPEKDILVSAPVISTTVTPASIAKSTSVNNSVVEPSTEIIRAVHVASADQTAALSSNRETLVMDSHVGPIETVTATVNVQNDGTQTTPRASVQLISTSSSPRPAELSTTSTVLSQSSMSTLDEQPIVDQPAQTSPRESFVPVPIDVQQPQLPDETLVVLPVQRQSTPAVPSPMPASNIQLAESLETPVQASHVPSQQFQSQPQPQLPPPHSHPAPMLQQSQSTHQPLILHAQQYSEQRIFDLMTTLHEERSRNQIERTANEANVKALMHSERLCDEIRQQLQMLRAEHAHQQQQSQRDKDNSNRENDVQQREIQELKRQLESKASCSTCDSLAAELSALKQSALLRESQLLKMIDSNSHSNHNAAQQLIPANQTAHSLELENAALQQRVALLQEQLTKSEHNAHQSAAALQQSELQIVTLQSTAQQSQRDIAALKHALEQETLRCQAAAQSVNDVSIKLKQSEDQMKLKLEEMAELRRQAREAHSETRSMEQQLSTALKRTKDLCAALMDARELCEAQAESVRQARDRADECEQQIDELRDEVAQQTARADTALEQKLVKETMLKDQIEAVSALKAASKAQEKAVADQRSAEKQNHDRSLAAARQNESEAQQIADELKSELDRWQQDCVDWKERAQRAEGAEASVRAELQQLQASEKDRALMVESIESGLVDMRQAHQTQLGALQTEYTNCQSQLADTKRRCDQYADAAQVASKQLEGVLDVAAQQRQVHDSETAAMRAQVKAAEELVKRTEDEMRALLREMDQQRQRALHFAQSIVGH